MDFRLTPMMAALTAALLTSGQPLPQAAPAVERPECPSHEFRPRDRKSFGPPITIPFVDEATNVPEFNDCQALIEARNGVKSYGPLVAVFAPQYDFPHYAADSLYLAAVIYNYGTMADPQRGYAPLRLQPGFSCVYVSAVSAVHKAYVTAQSGDPQCRLAVKVLPPGTADDAIHYQLDAHVRDTPPGAEVPRVARWDWDETQRSNYVGVACPRVISAQVVLRWCEFGPRDFRPSELPTMPQLPAGVQASAVYRVPGWFDQQELAVADDDGWSIRPSGFTGTFFPSPELARITVGTLRHWTYVGTITVTGVPAGYYEKFGFAADQPTHLSIIRIKGRNLTEVPPECRMFTAWGCGRMSTGATNRYIPIYRNHHDEIPIPATTRWRWSWDDETTWVRCDAGCCSPTN